MVYVLIQHVRYEAARATRGPARPAGIPVAWMEMAMAGPPRGAGVR